MPSRPSGREWRYVLSHFRNIIYGANTRKHSEVMSKMPIGSSPSQASATRISTWMGYCSDYHFAKLNYESEIFESSNACWKEVSSQNRLGCCPSWFKFVASGKQKVQSLIYPIVQTRQFVLFATDKNPLEFPDVMKMWISCCALSNYRCSCSRVREISVLSIYQG